MGMMTEKTDKRLRPPFYRSIFVRHVAVMAITGVSLVLIVALFFLNLFSPYFSTSRRLVGEYTRLLASTSPDQETARELAEHLDLKIRYEGPEGTWETAPGLPSVQEVRGYKKWHDFYLAPGAKGGTYVVSWEMGQRMRKGHYWMLQTLHLLMIGVVLAAWLILRRTLQPLRWLHEGVTRLSEGELDVVVPKRTRDEFGVLTDAFNQMVRRIRDMVRARDQLLLDVSHELRSPLTRIKVALELLPEGEKRRRIASDIGEMEAMITELLELERLRDGHGIRAERQDLMPILHEMAESFQDRPPGVRIVSAPPEVLLEIDGNRIRTVLRNLLENAVKYSLPDSGPVEISVVSLPDNRDSETVTVRVTDDGPGIPETDLANLFEPFFRVDRSRSKKSGGYGLGLSICKRILEAHGGTITAENNRGRGRGATFTLTFPAR
jgi:signal transduction histidine kinase